MDAIASSRFEHELRSSGWEAAQNFNNQITFITSHTIFTNKEFPGLEIWLRNNWVDVLYLGKLLLREQPELGLELFLEIIAKWALKKADSLMKEAIAISELGVMIRRVAAS